MPKSELKTKNILMHWAASIHVSGDIDKSSTQTYANKKNKSNACIFYIQVEI